MSHELPIPPELANLAADNTRTLRQLGIPTDDSQKAGMLFAQRRFTGFVQTPTSEFELSEQENTDDVDRLMRNIGDLNPGMILIRPDMYHHRQAFVDFLLEHGFCPHYIVDTTISESAYEQMYHDVFQRAAARPALPNRTLVYTDSPVTLIMFSDPARRYGEAKLADKIVQHFKGEPGVPDEQTLRGKVVFQEATRLGYHRLDNPTVAQAVDPIGAYRQAVQSKQGPHLHLPEEYQLLNYTGVGVHVPDFKEMMRDLPLICNRKQLEEIRLHLQYPNIDLYKWLWNKGVLPKPFVIALGGYAGTSKSTLARTISDWLPYHERIATPHLRELAKSSIPPEINPWLYVHTWNLDTVSADFPVDAKTGFVRQIEPVAEVIERIITFAGTERQHHVVEGNHVFPGKVTFPPTILGIELYLKVSDPESHRVMLGGPTHQRSLSEHEFEVARELHDFTVFEAEKQGKPVFEYTGGFTGLLGLLNEQFQTEIESTFLGLIKDDAASKQGYL
ncbi:hypothetical protein HY468_02490 [Candidatus Roizmanbacteria bacterium]|nr:hypothetical protein [Candidatus Roizmanbacteria bacterium]